MNLREYLLDLESRIAALEDQPLEEVDVLDTEVDFLPPSTDEFEADVVESVEGESVPVE